MIVASGSPVPRKGGVSIDNKNVYICFLVAIAMMAASPMRAAGPLAGPGPDSGTPRQTVVRVDARSGKLIRSVAPVSRPAAKTQPAPKPEIATMVEEAAKANRVDPLLVHSVIQAESNFNPYAVSAKGAEGLMQLMPPTARQLGVRNSFDPKQNIEAGVRYLKQLQDLFQDDRLALAAYNAGPGAVDKYHGVPPYRETRQYVARIIRDYNRKKLAERRIQHTSRAAKAAHPATHHRTVVVAGAVVPAAGN